MELSAELLELLREVRNGQRELLTLARMFLEEDARRYRQWREREVTALSRAPREQEAQAAWQEANEVYLSQQRRHQRATWVVVPIIVLVGVALCVGIAVSQRL